MKSNLKGDFDECEVASLHRRYTFSNVIIATFGPCHQGFQLLSPPQPIKRATGDLRDHGISLSLRLRGGKGRVRGALPNFNDDMVTNSKFTDRY